MQVSGLQHHAPQDVVPGTTTVELVGTIAHVLSSSPEGDQRENGVWESNGSVRAYLRGALAPGMKHTIGIKVRNPVSTISIVSKARYVTLSQPRRTRYSVRQSPLKIPPADYATPPDYQPNGGAAAGIHRVRG